MKNRLEKIKTNLDNTASNINKHTKKLRGNSLKIAKDVSEDTGKILKGLSNSTEKAFNSVKKRRTKPIKKTDIANNKVDDNTSKLDMFSSKLRKKAVDDYNSTVKRYEDVAQILESVTQKLYHLRQESVILVEHVENHINQLANTPKEFQTSLKKIAFEIETFQHKQAEIKKAEIEAKLAARGSSAGATLSALGVAVATMGPTAAIGIATTFGIASTGTAISTLSGAAATNAALAWLGGGALAAGGGGMTAGNALLLLAGPVGWTIAGVALTASVGTGLFASHKNKETAKKLVGERENLELVIRKFNRLNVEVESLIDVTNIQMDGVREIDSLVVKTDFNKFSKDEKIQAGVLVNLTLTLAQLINKEINIDD